MAVKTPPFLGLIAKKNGRTKGFLDRCLIRMLKWERLTDPKATLADADIALDQDEHLFACSIAMNTMDFQRLIDELEKEGCVRGIDFVATASGHGVIDDPVPLWLREELVALGNFPHLAGKLEPAALNALENRLVKQYVFQ